MVAQDSWISCHELSGRYNHKSKLSMVLLRVVRRKNKHPSPTSARGAVVDEPAQLRAAFYVRYLFCTSNSLNEILFVGLVFVGLILFFLLPSRPRPSFQMRPVSCVTTQHFSPPAAQETLVDPAWGVGRNRTLVASDPMLWGLLRPTSACLVFRGGGFCMHVVR